MSNSTRVRFYRVEGNLKIPVIIRSQTMDHETLISKAIANGDDGENLLDSLLYEADGRVELTSYLDFCLDMMQQDEPDRSPRLMLQEVLGNDFGV